MKSVIDRMNETDAEARMGSFRAKQQMPYDFKVKYAKIRAWEFYKHPEIAGKHHFTGPRVSPSGHRCRRCRPA